MHSSVILKLVLRLPAVSEPVLRLCLASELALKLQTSFRATLEDLAPPQKNLGWPQKNLGSPQKNLGWPQENLGSPQENLGWPQENLGSPQENLGSPLSLPGCTSSSPRILLFSLARSKIVVLLILSHSLACHISSNTQQARGQDVNDHLPAKPCRPQAHHDQQLLDHDAAPEDDPGGPFNVALCMLAAPESAGGATRGQVLKRHIPSKCPIERFVHLLHRHKWGEACRCCAKCCSNILQCDVGRINAIHFAAVCFELSNGSNCHPKDEPSSSPLFEEDLIILLPNGIVLFSLQSNTNVRKTLQKNSCAKRFLDGLSS